MIFAIVSALVSLVYSGRKCFSIESCIITGIVFDLLGAAYNNMISAVDSMLVLIYRVIWFP